MRDRSILSSDYKQTGNVCLLASYAFLLEYGGVFQESKSISSVYDVLSRYTDFHNTLETVTNYTSCYIVEHKEECEIYISNIINQYCQTHGHIAGYEQIASFHKFLCNEGDIKGIEFVKFMPASGEDRSTPIEQAYENLCHFLKQCDNDYDHVALILYLINNKAHTVFLGYDGSFFIRDSNYTNVKEGPVSFGFQFNQDANITEYMLFKINK